MTPFMLGILGFLFMFMLMALGCRSLLPWV